ncbi:hypothetical protein H7849_20640 [Alloacidobacterium dinghuense]|uniref:Uncharacterized protein n=1 Tax=Alloacidobacterium dinghuense TaxID=2763107 RepID=A0A7G8BFY8_9BACT|nr:hypothetical protein [Alloacidobacterium dinghuense]QNI31458.1 hypothetical protein H7849_20640 [Alloacidobacterium dinghuense]
MHTPNPHEHESHNKAASVREGYEVTDVSAHGIIVFLIGLFISVAVFFVFCFGMGKVINNALVKRDGPPNRWNQGSAEAGKTYRMESSPALEQQQLNQLTQAFPTPRLQGDDGNQDTADLHAREDLLLDNYSWIDRSKGTVRIPIERAMELIAQRGLPVQQQPQASEPLMAGDSAISVQVPLTDGFARTAYEQQLREGAAHEPGEQASSKANNN